MYLCYLDESGVPEIPGNSTHFVLAGIAIPIERWREADAAISAIMDHHFADTSCPFLICAKKIAQAE